VAGAFDVGLFCGLLGRVDGRFVVLGFADGVVLGDAVDR
jgi:hypothetical protein